MGYSKNYFKTIIQSEWYIKAGKKLYRHFLCADVKFYLPILLYFAFFAKLFLKMAHTPAVLVLQDGTVFHGTAFGKIGTTTGEICFNTGMTGYREVLQTPAIMARVNNEYGILGVNYGVKTLMWKSDGCKK